MGYKTENWQDIEVGDVVEVLNTDYVNNKFTGEKEVLATARGWPNHKIIDLVNDNEEGDGFGLGWAFQIGDSNCDQVRLIRKKKMTERSE